MTTCDSVNTTASVQSEASVQAAVRVIVSQAGWRVFRNNVGVLVDDRGVPVRYGLCNESPAQNQSMKSGDLIGIRPVVITQDMVGKTIGQFVSIEAKHSGWRYSGKGREVAQRRWIDFIRSLGGFAIFSNGAIDTSVNTPHNATSLTGTDQ